MGIFVKIKKGLLSYQQIYNKFVLWYRRVNMTKPRPIINGMIYLVSDKGAVSFGKNVKINSSLVSNPIGGSTRTIFFARPKAEIVIGNNVGISNSALFAAKKIVIEDDVLIGGDCRIYDTDFHSLDYDLRMKSSDATAGSAPVQIKRGAFIGAGCTILKGVIIGEKSVIAAGSVVTHSVPDSELWGGVPARYIKKID